MLNILNPRPILEDISIVIPTLSRPILEQCLEKIASGTAWPGELIIVDQGNSAQTASWIELLNSSGLAARHLPSDGRGRAAGVNQGLQCVQTRFAAITDDDCFPDPGWLHEMVNVLRKNPLSIVTGRVEAAGHHTVNVVTSFNPAVYRKPRLKYDNLSGGNMGTSIDVIQRVGFFDEDPRLRTAEDAEWSYRALRMGVPIIYAPNVSVDHYGWRDSHGRIKQYQSYARSHGGFYGKYIRNGDSFILVRTLVHHARALNRWVTGLLSRDSEMAAVGKAYFLGLLPGILAGMRANR